MFLKLEDKIKIYQAKPVLREIYKQWYEEIGIYLKPGKTLEIGSDMCLVKKYLPEVITSDIKEHGLSDIMQDACNLTLPTDSLDNIIGIDILHHLIDYKNFFSGSLKVLNSGGRIIFIEPHVSIFSYLVRKLFHREKISFKYLNKSHSHPDEANTALPTMLFKDQENYFFDKKFKIVLIKKMDIVTYLLSGGYNKINLVPKFMIKPVFKINSFLEKFNFLLKYFSFKMLIVLEKI